MEWLFSLLALPYDGTGGRYPTDVERLRIRLQSPADGDDGMTLLAISRLLRLLCLPARLRHFQQPDVIAAANSPTRENRPHPDAATVLEHCRQHNSRWRRASINGLELVYRYVLKERCEAKIQRLLFDEERENGPRVLSAIRALTPRGAEDDPLVVWAKLVWRFPTNRGFEYLPEQIMAAWSEAVNDQKRVDALGSIKHGSLDSRAVTDWLAAHSVLPWQSLSNAEIIESCCRRQTRVVRSYMVWCLSSEGDWPETLLAELKRSVGNVAIDLSPGQEKHCRRQIRRRWRA